MPGIQSDAKDETTDRQADDSATDVERRKSLTNIDEAAIHELQVGSENRGIFYKTSSNGTRLVLAKVKGNRYIT